MSKGKWWMAELDNRTLLVELLEQLAGSGSAEECTSFLASMFQPMLASYQDDPFFRRCALALAYARKHGWVRSEPMDGVGAPRAPMFWELTPAGRGVRAQLRKRWGVW